YRRQRQMGIRDRISVYQFSIDALNQLKIELEKTPLATGGFLTIIDYILDGFPNLMIVLIKNAKGIGINEKMDLEEIDTLDIDLSLIHI
ncbi:nucleoid-associated protein, partial [Pseudomonas aeruginosa]